MKYCTVCKENKLDSDFYYRSDKPYLLQSHCKKCILEKRRNYQKKNIEYFKEKDRKYSKINRYKKLIYLKNWQQSNRDYINAKFKEKHNNNLNFKMSNNIRTRIRNALKRNSKSSSSFDLIGCDLSYLKHHLESKFTNGMSWENYGDWQIDHKIPCSFFDLSNEENQKLCFHYSNLQPLWKEDNLRKSSKLEMEVCYRKKIY